MLDDGSLTESPPASPLPPPLTMVITTDRRTAQNSPKYETSLQTPPSRTGLRTPTRLASPRSWFLALAALRATLLESRCSIPAATCRATQCALVPAVSPALSQCGPCSGCDAFAAFGERRAKTVPPFRRARHVADDCALRLSTDVTSHDCRHRFVHGRTKPMPRARLPAASLVQSTQPAPSAAGGFSGRPRRRGGGVVRTRQRAFMNTALRPVE